MDTSVSSSAFQRISLKTPLKHSVVRTLRAGDRVLLSGVLYTARDAAHQRMIQTLEKGGSLPFDPFEQTLYYVGPAPTRPGAIIGPAGPTSSYRMDRFTPILLQQGLSAMIGKGKRSLEVVEAIKKYGALYFGAVGGAAALIAASIRKASVVAYEDLGPEAVHRLEVIDFPLVVLIDSLGNNLYESEPPKYRQ